MFKRITLASLAVLGLSASSAHAADGPGRYSGIGIGQVNISLDGSNFDESDMGYKFFGGMFFNKNFGLELAYTDGANPHYSSSGTSLEVSPSAFTIEGIGRFPLGQSLSVFGKAGIAFYDIYAQGRVLGLSFGNSESGSEFVYGVGLSLGLGPKFELRGEWEQLSIDLNNISGDYSMLTLDGVFKF